MTTTKPQSTTETLEEIATRAASFVEQVAMLTIHERTRAQAREIAATLRECVSVSPASTAPEQFEIEQIRARAYNSIQFSADVYMHDVRRLLRMFAPDATEGAR